MILIHIHNTINCVQIPSFMIDRKDGATVNVLCIMCTKHYILIYHNYIINL